MAEIRCGLDWFQVSASWPTVIKDWPALRQAAEAVLRSTIPYIDTLGWTPERVKDYRVLPMAGYPNTYDMLYASCHVDPNRREQKIGVRYTSQNLNAYRALGGTEGRLIEFYHDLGAKASRIDIAFDLFDYGIDPIKLYQDWEKGKVETRARTASPLRKVAKVKGQTVAIGATAYFGGRESDEYWRIYHKGLEQVVDSDWVRFEVELKGDRVVAAQEDIYKHGIEAVGKQLLRDQFTKMPYRFWKDLTEGKSVPLTPVGRKQTAHDAWLLNVIIPMIQDDMQSEWEGTEDRGITRSVEALMREHWTRRKMRIREQYGVCQK